jgi:HTH-type transcriptional regulator/antitoxin MqsA
MTEASLLCPECESGLLQPNRYSDRFQHQGKNLVVDDLEGYLCLACEADRVFEGQIRRNHAQISDTRRRADGLLTGEQIWRTSGRRCARRCSVASSPATRVSWMKWSR